MTAKFLGRLHPSSSTITVERTDAGHTSGPHTVSISDGAYYVLGRGMAKVTAASSGTIVTMAGGHPFEIGDVVAIRDTSAGSWIEKHIEVQAVTSTTIKVSSSVTVAVDDAVCLSHDLLGLVEVLIFEKDTTELDGILSWTASSSGIVSISTSDAVATVDISWPDSTIRDWLRFSAGGTVSSGSPMTGAYCHAGGWYPSLSIQDELHRLRPQRSVAISDTGIAHARHYETREQWLIRQRWRGSPFSGSYDEYHAIDQFWRDILAPLEPVRWFRSATENQAYSRHSNPDGWLSISIVSPLDRELHPVVSGWYDLWEETWIGEVFTPTSTEEGPS